MLHDKLKAVRIKNSLKQSEVASQIGCASTSFTNWESGKVNPPLEQLEKICTFYGIDPLDLLTHRPTMEEIKRIANLPYTGRTYEETVALNVCGSVFPDSPDSPDSTGDEHTPDEDEVLRIYKGLKPDEKQFVLRMLRGLTREL